MPNLDIQLEEEEFEILKQTKSFIIYDLQKKEKTGDFDVPEDLIKTSTGPLASQLNKEAQQEGLSPDHYKIEYYLVLAPDAEECNDLGFIQEEKAIITASSEVGAIEVNGEKNDFKLYLLGICL